MVGKKLNFLMMGIISISHPVEAHRKYWHDSANDEVIVESNDPADYNLASDGTVTKKKDNAKKSSSIRPGTMIKPQDKSTVSKENSLATPGNPATPQMPTAIKGVGIPGSPHQAEVSHAPVPQETEAMSKDKALKVTDDSKADHGHLIQIPRAASE